MITLSREDQEDYSDVIGTTKHWVDCCSHPEDSYVCSFRIISTFRRDLGKRIDVDERYDLYLYADRDGTKHLCIRYGNACSEYISPGEVTEFILRHPLTSHSMIANDEYQMVALILHKYGSLSYSLNL